MYKHRYTEEEIAFLRDNAEGNTREIICGLFNAAFGTSVTVRSIGSIMSRNGIKNRLQGYATRFEKGKEAWNKNMKGLQLGGDAGWFQKGAPSYRAIPVGSERVEQEFIKIKIAEPNVWTVKHRYIWEQKYGPIPDDCVILFKDMDKHNVQLDNLFMTKRTAMTSVAKRGLRTEYPEINEPLHTLAELELKIKRSGEK